MPFIARSITWIETEIVTNRHIQAQRFFFKNSPDGVPTEARHNQADNETMAMVKAAAIHCKFGSAIGREAMNPAVAGKSKYVKILSMPQAVNVLASVRIN